MTIDGLRADYDETPYSPNSFPQSAPGRLAAIAHLFGLGVPDVGSARVLEIGCAGGGNLIPFAAAHPHARAVGIDLSPVQIEQGREGVRSLGLTNLDLQVGDIAELDPKRLGTFDYVIAHGVYSWVPPHVQEALLALVRAVLAPTGVAYVSYNTYPGWKSKEIVRDAMLLASGTSATQDEKVADARDMVDFLAEIAPPEGVLARLLAESKAFDEVYGDSYLLHDELEKFNAPCYFYEMLGRAGAHGLAYLAEAHLESMMPGNFGPTVEEFVRRKSAGAQVLVEQYLDFVTNRMFRESLLVHAERAPHIRYTPDRSRYADLHVAAYVPPAEGLTQLDNTRQEYVESDGATLFTNDPGIKAALDALSARWPWTQHRDELVDAVRARLEAAGLTPSGELAVHLDNLIGILILQGQARFRLDPVLPDETGLALRLDDRVRRMVQVQRPDGSAATYTPWHETVMLSDLDRRVFPLLDGTLDGAALLATLTGEVDAAAAAEYVEALPGRLHELQLARIG